MTRGSTARRGTALVVALIASMAAAGSLSPTAAQAAPSTFTGKFVSVSGASGSDLTDNRISLTEASSDTAPDTVVGTMTVGFEGNSTDVNGTTTQICFQYSVDLSNQPVSVLSGQISATVTVSATTRDGPCSAQGAAADQPTTEQDSLSATVTDSTIDGTLEVQGGGGNFVFATTRQGAPAGANSGVTRSGVDFGTPLDNNELRDVVARSSCPPAEFSKMLHYQATGLGDDTENEACLALAMALGPFYSRVGNLIHTSSVRGQLAQIETLASFNDPQGRPVLPSLRHLMPVIVAMARQSDQPGGPTLDAMRRLVRLVIQLDTTGSLTPGNE